MASRTRNLLIRANARRGIHAGHSNAEKREGDSDPTRGDEHAFDYTVATGRSR